MVQSYKEVQDWEKAIGITVSHLENHQEYHLQMAKAYHITWKNLDDSFMGHSIEYWVNLYRQDKHLNNHPLRYFDAFHPGDRLTARSLPGKTHLSLSMTVCMRKCVIRDAVLRYLKQCG